MIIEIGVIVIQVRGLASEIPGLTHYFLQIKMIVLKQEYVRDFDRDNILA